MKRIIKTAVLMIALAVSFVLFAVSAGAAEKLSTSVDYDYYGTAFVKITPSLDYSRIRYTTDGTSPTLMSEAYFLDEEIQINTKTTLRIAEFNTEGEKVAAIKKTVSPKTTTPTFTVLKEKGVSFVSMECVDGEAVIYYTTDGSLPTEKSNVYTDTINITKTTTFRAMAIREGAKRSSIVTKKAFVSENDPPAIDKSEPEVEEPSVKTGEVGKISYEISNISDKGYSYVEFFPSRSSNKIYYTTDGSKPTKESVKFKKRFRIYEPTVIRAREYNKKGQLVGSIKFNVKPRVTPVTVKGTAISIGTVTIELSCETEGADIYYTLDGTAPTDEYAIQYTGPLTIALNSNMQAVAVKDGYLRSQILSVYGSEISVELKNYDPDNPIYSETVRIINEYRRSCGLTELVLDPKLNKAANIRAFETSILNDHKRPNGKHYSTVISDAGLTVDSSCEIYFGRCKTPQEFVERLLNNKNNASIAIGKDSMADIIGIGYYERGAARYWVLLTAKE